MFANESRFLQDNQVVLDQADFFQPDGFTRVLGLTVSDVTSEIFYNEVQQAWPLVSGLGVTDAQVTQGFVYFNEIPGSPGFYSVRFRTSAVGYWRNLVSYASGTQILTQDRGRALPSNKVVQDQADFFQSDGFTRVSGLNQSTVVSQLFFENTLLPWPMISGLGLTDDQLTTGLVYFNEIPGAVGYYSLRFRPNAVGYWRCLLTYAAGSQILAQDYDLEPENTGTGGLLGDGTVITVSETGQGIHGVQNSKCLPGETICHGHHQVHAPNGNTSQFQVQSTCVDVVKVPPPKTIIRWHQVFGKGDLEFIVRDKFRNPLGPISVSYTMFQVLKGGLLHQVGPSSRNPAKGTLGQYYVTGTAGENGQPGVWVVRWTYQVTFDSPVLTKDYWFKVSDAVAARIPGDTLVRKCQKEWSEY